MYGIDQIIDKKKKLFHGLPQEEMQRRAKISGGLLDALATEKVLAEKADAKNALNLAMEGSQKTIVQENEDALLGRTQQETAEGVAGVLKNKKKRMDENLKRIAQMGLGGAKRPNMAVPMAQGGIIGYFDGKAIDMENDEEKEKEKLRSPLEIILGDLKKKIFGDNTDSGTFTANRPEVKTADGKTVTLDETDQRRLGQGVMQTYPQGAGIGPETLDEDFLSQLALIKNYQSPQDKTQDKKDIPFTGPTDPTDLFPQINEKLKNPPKDVEPGDTKEDLDAKNKEYNEWLERLLTVLSAPASGRGLGGGNVARAYLQYSQRIFDNRAKIREIEAEELEAQAKTDLNKLSRDELSYSRLVGRQTQLLKIIQDVRDKATESFKFRLIGLNATVSDMSKPESERAKAANEIKAINNLIKDAVEDSTKKERALLKEVAIRLNMLGFDESAGSKQISK